MSSGLRPMGIGEIFDRSFFILRKNFGTLIKLHVMVFLPVLTLLVLALVGGVAIHMTNPFLFQQFAKPETLSAGSAFLLIGLIIFAIGLFFLMMVLMHINMYGTYRIFDAGVRNEKMTWKEALKGWPLGALFLFLAAMILGTVGGIAGLLIAIPIVIVQAVSPILAQVINYGLNVVISVFTVLALPIVVLEKKDPVTPIWRGVCLAAKNFWRALGVILLYTLLSMCLTAVILVLFMLPIVVIIASSGASVADPQNLMKYLLSPAIIALAVGLVLMVLFLWFVLVNLYLGLQVLLVYDFKMRSEGYDLLPPEETGLTTVV